MSSLTASTAAQPSFSTTNEVEPKGEGYPMVIKASAGVGMLVVGSAGLVNGEGKIGNAYIPCHDYRLGAAQNGFGRSWLGRGHLVARLCPVLALQ